MKKHLIFTLTVISVLFISCEKKPAIKNDEISCRKLEGNWTIQTKTEFNIESQSDELQSPFILANAVALTTTTLSLNPDPELKENKYTLTINQNLDSFTPLKDNPAIEEKDLSSQIEKSIIISGIFFANNTYLQLCGEKVSINSEAPVDFDLALNLDNAIGNKITNLFWFIQDNKLNLTEIENPENKITYIKD